MVALARAEIYPDGWDDIVGDFIRSREPFPGYWERSEERALQIVQKRVVDPSAKRLLDIGCGRGRLLPFFAHMFGEIVAIDGQDRRLSVARESAARARIENVEFVECLFPRCPTSLGMFDVVLCSHVVQHLQPQMALDLVKGVEAVLNTGGLFVLMTAYSGGDDDVYKLWRRCKDGHSIIEEFCPDWRTCEIAMQSRPENDIVPTRAFGRLQLKALLSGFQQLDRWLFHDLAHQNMDKPQRYDKSTIDELINTPEAAGKYGIDILLISERI